MLNLYLTLDKLQPTKCYHQQCDIFVSHLKNVFFNKKLNDILMFVIEQVRYGSKG